MQGATPSSAEVPVQVLRDQLSSLLGLLVLSLRMTESRDERQILELATTSVPSLVDGRVQGAFLDGRWLFTSGPVDGAEVRADLEAQFAVTSEAGGVVSVPDQGWGWAFPLRSLAGHLGHLVVGADAEPSTLEQFLLRVLAQQVGMALANARLHDRELAASAVLRETNARLAESVAAIRRRAAIHERLTRAAMTGTGLAGVAEAIHELTGRAIVIEDRAGSVLARAGTDGADGLETHVRQPRAARERTISRLLEAGGLVREPGRVAVVAGPTDGVAGVLWMIDPDGTADEAAIVALEHGATIAAMELSRLRNLGETQLRLGRDLLDDLLAGVDPQLAMARARVIGCNLAQPRRIAVIEPVDSTGDEDRLIGAGRRALRDDSAGWLLTTVGGALVVLADAGTDWSAFRATFVRSYDGPCRIGVGGLVIEPGDVPRSHREARLALKMGRESTDPSALIAFDELGVFRLLAEVEEPATVERFVRTWLGPLLDYDARKPADLVPTLSRFLELGQAYDSTSKALAIHRSTLKYRLQRIREISQRDLSDPDTQFNFQLATRAWQTLLALRGTPAAEVDRQPRGVSQTR